MTDILHTHETYTADFTNGGVTAQSRGRRARLSVHVVERCRLSPNSSSSLLLAMQCVPCWTRKPFFEKNTYNLSTVQNIIPAFLHGVVNSF